MRPGHLALGCRSEGKRERGKAKRLVGAERLVTVSPMTVSACALAIASSVRWRTECELLAMVLDSTSAKIRSEDASSTGRHTVSWQLSRPCCPFDSWQ